MKTTSLALKDRSRGTIWLSIRDGVVVGAMGSDPKRFIGLTVALAQRLARTGSLVAKRKRRK